MHILLILIVVLCSYPLQIISLKKTRATDWDISLLTENGLTRMTLNHTTGNFSINETRLEDDINHYLRSKKNFYIKPLKLTAFSYDCLTRSFLLFDEYSATVFIWYELSGNLTVLLQEVGIRTIEYDPLTKTLYWIYSKRNIFFDLMSARIKTDREDGSRLLGERKKICWLPLSTTSVKLLYQRYTRDLIVAINTPVTFILIRIDLLNKSRIRLMDSSPALKTPPMIIDSDRTFLVDVHQMVVREACAKNNHVQPTGKRCFSFSGCQLIDIDWNDDLLFIVTHCSDKNNSVILATNLTDVSPKTYNTWVFYDYHVDNIKLISFGRDHYISYLDYTLFLQKILRITMFTRYEDKRWNHTNETAAAFSIKQFNFAASRPELTAILIKNKFPYSYCLFTKTIKTKGEYSVHRFITRYL